MSAASRIKKLRNHVPIGGLSTREPVDGTENPLRVSLGFSPAWYHERCGVSFTEKYSTDPYYRFECLTKMKAELKCAFPSVPYWDSSNREATLSGVYGLGVVPGAFGMPILHAPDRWPTLDHNRRLSLETIEGLTVAEVLGSPQVDDLFRQMDIIEKEWGMIFGYPNWQGVLNTAFNLRGQEIFTDMYDRPELVHHFLGVIADVMIWLATTVEERQRASGFDIDLLSVSNCVMNMISPDAYKEFVYPHDRRIAESFDRFGVHTCEWDVTPYIEVLSELPKLGYLDMGMMSDMARVRRTFPDTHRVVICSPYILEDSDPKTIEKDMTEIYTKLGPCDVVVDDIHPDVPDERVRDLLEICDRVANSAEPASPSS